jgi:hypothetical protein
MNSEENLSIRLTFTEEDTDLIETMLASELID